MRSHWKCAYVGIAGMPARRSAAQQSAADHTRQPHQPGLDQRAAEHASLSESGLQWTLAILGRGLGALGVGVNQVVSI